MLSLLGGGERVYCVRGETGEAGWLARCLEPAVQRLGKGPIFGCVRDIAGVTAIRDEFINGPVPQALVTPDGSPLCRWLHSVDVTDADF